MKPNKRIRGRIMIKPIEFSEIYEVEVKRANKTSGRIYLPSEFIGKKVYVLLDEKKTQKMTQKRTHPKIKKRIR